MQGPMTMRLCPLCGGKGTALSVDAVLPDGTLVNPRKAPCMACEGHGSVVPEAKDADGR